MTHGERRTLRRGEPALPPQFAHPPTLPALTVVDGLTSHHQVLANRNWQMPSLQRVETAHRMDAYALGRFISTSRSLRHLLPEDRDVSCPHRDTTNWAEVFEHVPVSPAGEAGPLAQLETIGLINLGYLREDTVVGLRRLQEVLVSRGCRRSLAKLDVSTPCDTTLNSDALLAIRALDEFNRKCCRSPEIPFTFHGISLMFDLSLFYSDHFPSRPSRFFTRVLMELAAKAELVQYLLTQHDLTHPVDSPSEAAIAMAKSLSFDKACVVKVGNRNGFDPPADTHTPAPQSSST
uniref:Uncharacterized protein n=1 Tax=Vitrella brassicaformis TaxID=1169539 RepID=A0A7S1P3I5_9ALVE